MNTINHFTLPFCLLNLLFVSVGYSQNVGVNWNAFNGGFAVHSAPNTTVKSAAGQMLVGSGREANNAVASGFLANPLLRGLPVSVGENKELPLSYSLSQNYPNPFNPSTIIKYQIPSASRITLKVFDILGREVATLVNDVEEPGYKSVQWNASGFSSGVYFYRLQAGNFVASKKALLLK